VNTRLIAVNNVNKRAIEMSPWSIRSEKWVTKIAMATLETDSDDGRAMPTKGKKNCDVRSRDQGKEEKIEKMEGGKRKKKRRKKKERFKCANVRG